MPSASVNVQYFVDFVRRTGPQSRVLDYGCGRAVLVRALRSVGVDAYGADVFFEGMDFEQMKSDPLVADGVVRAIPSTGNVPFPDNWFDLIITDQVLEHVTDIETVATEIERMLAPDGRMLHHFPTLEVWREPHFNVWFSHRLPSTVRRPYLRWSHALGLGKDVAAYPDAASWAIHVDGWLAAFCQYRPERDVVAAFHGVKRRAELDYCIFRATATNRRLAARLLAIPWLQRPEAWLFRRLAFSAIEVGAGEAPGSASASSARRQDSRT